MENTEAISAASQISNADEMSVGDPTNENRLNNDLEYEQNSHESESDSPELTPGKRFLKRRKTAQKKQNQTLLNFEESPHHSNQIPIWNLNQNRSKSDTPRTTRNPIINRLSMRMKAM